jgi:hypothetical protein
LRRFSLCGALASHEKGTIQEGIFIFLLRCQLGGAKYEKDIDCRRDGRQRRSQIKRFAICIMLAPRRSALFLELRSPAMEQTPTVARAERNLLAAA